MRRVAFAVGAGFAIACFGLSCGRSGLPAPRYARQPTSALVEVAYPPPPARVERVPEQPRPDAVWIDGEWTWQGRRWAWRPGRWVEPPRGAVFSPWTLVRDSSGTLYVAAGTWRAEDGGAIDEPPPLRPGKPTAGAMVNPEDEPIGPAATTPADAAPTIADSGPAPPDRLDAPPPLDASIREAAMPDVATRDAILPSAPQ